MAIAIVTGSTGLIGSESILFFARKGFETVGIDNDLRSYFFGKEGSTATKREFLKREVLNYTHYSIDIRNSAEIELIFKKYGRNTELIIHTAAQPSHDWSYKEPQTDFFVNAVGTLNLLEATRQHCPGAVFIFTSTNKVYGDRPNSFPLVEKEKRFEIAAEHPYYEYGFDENLSIDQCKHSIFGASKVAADVMVQEYARHFALQAGVFRGGCLTGPAHSSVELHGFLAYLAKCAALEKQYTVFGYNGKQVRDNIHSYDLVNAFWHFFNDPQKENPVYNLGGSREINCSILEAIDLLQEITGKEVRYRYSEQNRIGDPKWLIGDIRKFRRDFPAWDFKYNLKEILHELVAGH